MDIKDFATNDPLPWCPGCGNFSIITAVKKALVKLDKQPNEILLVSGIGQAAKLPHFIRANCFNGLHGRALPAATGAKIANRALSVIITTGDGDCYGEGGNHLLHAIRRNIDVTVVVHDNQIYGLTKGQASPTTDEGFVTKVQPEGVILAPFEPLEFAIALGAGFVARGFARDADFCADLIAEGARHKGFALIDILQPCVTFNKKNTYQWYADRVYKIDDDAAYDAKDKDAALKKAREWGDKIPVGIIYKNENRSYEEKSGLTELPPLVDLRFQERDLAAVFNEIIF
jgi:2-oxoglutarate ferredoxin oxidoreductase subunit beta